MGDSSLETVIGLDILRTDIGISVEGAALQEEFIDLSHPKNKFTLIQIQANTTPATRRVY